MKTYNQAPLPFQGQKRRFLARFREALRAFPPSATYVDLFGGSGLLSETVRATVVWNDYDDFRTRLENIPATNALLAKLRDMAGDVPRKAKFPGEARERIMEAIAAEPFADHVTLSANVLFSGRYATDLDGLRKEGFYNRIRMVDYPGAEDYLAGVQRVRTDYRELFALYKDRLDTVFLVDPPYLSTDTSSYRGGEQWKIRDYLDVLDVLASGSYFYFSSSKSQIVELCGWIGKRTPGGDPLAGATTVRMSTSTSYNSAYEDIMLYKNSPF